MTLRLDSRQSRQRSVLDQISNNTDMRLDTILNLMNDELTMPLRLHKNKSASDRRLYIDSIEVQTIDGSDGTGRNRTIQPISSTIPAFSGGYIEFPSATGGAITASGVTLQTSYTLTLAASNYIKVMVMITSEGKIALGFGTANTVKASATLPTPLSGTFAIGYVVLYNNAGTIANVADSDVYQFSGGGGGSGIGSGELNLITNGSDSANWSTANWSGTGASVTTTTSTSDLPLSGIVPTAIKIVSDGSAGAENTEYVSYAFTTPATMGVKLKVEFYMRPGTNFVASEWTVSIYQGSTRVSLSTDTSGATKLPNMSGKFVTYFDALASTAYTLRFARTTNAGSNNATLNVANVIVGPGIQPQGAVVGEWQSYTPTFDGLGTVTVTAARYRRVGSNMEIQGRITIGTPTATEAKIYLPLSLTASTGTTTQVVGYGARSTAGAIDFYLLSGSSGPGWLAIGRAATSEAGFSRLNGNTAFSGSEEFSFSAAVPIAEWAGSGTVQLAQNDVEYAWNSDVSATAEVTGSGYGYGPGGTSFPSTNWTVGTAYKRRVYFQTPIQPGDKVVLEVDVGSNGRWIQMEDLYTRFIANNTIYGPTIDPTVGSNFIDVIFGAGGPTPFGAASWGANSSQSWTALSANKWRVRKSSAGAAVGFGIVSPGTSAGLVSAAGLPGNTTGNAIPSGYVGELSASFSRVAAGVSTGSGNIGATVSIPSGIFLIVATCTAAGGSGMSFSAVAAGASGSGLTTLSSPSQKYSVSGTSSVNYGTFVGYVNSAGTSIQFTYSLTGSSVDMSVTGYYIRIA